jgi:plastocyanin
VLRFTNNDVMPHKLVQTAGPTLPLVHPNMNKMASSATVKLTRKGVYRFTTKPGEDYAWARSMKTAGVDNVLHLTVHVK